MFLLLPDETSLPYPKPVRVVDRAVVRAVRKDYCERCGARAYGEPHHIRPRSLGGSDVCENLIELCFECHRAADDGEVSPYELIVIVARREGIDAADVCRRTGWPVPEIFPDVCLPGVGMPVGSLEDFLAGVASKECSTADDLVDACVAFIAHNGYAAEDIDQLMVTAEQNVREENRKLGLWVSVRVKMGLKPKEIAAKLNRSESYVKKLIRTFRAFPLPEDWNPELTWEHHAAAAATDDPVAWLARAADEGWSTRDLRKRYLEHKNEGHIVREEEDKEMEEAKRLVLKVQAVIERGGPAGRWLREQLSVILSQVLG